ncbi:helix-turn-helix domain-containing protein [Nocardia otitidiscaviarum]|uniref:helix-turn-helix domain-containing protein n=1 Tax=Nocardia otitidiscaviarum TaxID=1823 RepID=UPI0024567F10|nr:helix-turn-helix domain-containing protein [Nocardia otitidiscaviarum]
MRSPRRRKDADKPEVVLIPLSEGGELVKVHPKTLRRWISQGKLTGYRLASNQIRINRSELLGLARPLPAATPIDRDGVA